MNGQRCLQQVNASILAIVFVAGCAGPVVTTAPPSTPATRAPAPVQTAAPTAKPAAPAEPAEIVFYNGELLTMEEGQPLAEAVAIRKGLIQAVGTNEEILALQASGTVAIDLQGRTLMPGFIDGHTHILAFPERKGKSLAEAQEVALRYGFTTVNEMWADSGFLNELMQAEQAGSLRLRVNLFVSYNDGILDENHQKVFLKTWYPGHEPILDPTRYLRIPGVKIFVDGDNFSAARGCWALGEPFEPDAPALRDVPCATDRGDAYWTQDELNPIVADAQAAGYRVAFHAMGDGAIELSLNAIQYALHGEPNEIVRHQIEHSSLVAPAQLPRYQGLDILASVRGYGYAGCEDLSFLLPQFGRERMAWYANRYALAATDMHAYMETDFGWTIEPDNRFAQRSLDPIVQLYGMVTHRFVAEDGSTCDPDPLVAAHVVDMQRALEMLTIEPAYAVSMEDHLGSIAPGKFADLIILSGNPLTAARDDLIDFRVLLTMVQGQAEYCTSPYEPLCAGEVSPTTNVLPKGFHDGTQGQQDASGCVADGWAADPDDRDLDLGIRILVDGKEVAQGSAGNYRPDLADAGECPGGTCGFRLSLWERISHDVEHSVLAQARDGQSGEWTTLEQSPKTLICSGP